MNKFIRSYGKGMIGTGLVIAFLYGYAYGEKDVNEKSAKFIDESVKDIPWTFKNLGETMLLWPAFYATVAVKTVENLREKHKDDNEKDGSC